MFPPRHRPGSTRRNRPIDVRPVMRLRLIQNCDRCGIPRDHGNSNRNRWRTLVRIGCLALLIAVAAPATALVPALAQAQDAVRVELNTVENAENRCRMTFVIENKTSHAV